LIFVALQPPPEFFCKPSRFSLRDGFFVGSAAFFAVPDGRKCFGCAGSSPAFEYAEMLRETHRESVPGGVWGAHEKTEQERGES